MRSKPESDGRATPGKVYEAGITVIPTPARTSARTWSSLVLRSEKNGGTPRTVHLELWVKVKENWADSEMALKQFGFDTL